MPPKKPTAIASKVNEFVHVTGCTNRNTAEQLVSKHNNNVNDAVEEYFSGNYSTANAPVPQIPSATLEPEFQKYNDGDNKMQQNGIIKFFEDAGLNMEDIITFIFSYEAKAESMGVFSKEEFIKAMSALRIKNAKEFGTKANEIRDKFKPGTPSFNELFKFVFGFFSGGKKSITGEEAGTLLGMIVAGKYPLANKLINYLTQSESPASKEAIYKDTWNMIHHLLKNVQSDGTGYSADDAWPLLIVNFMETIVKK